MEWVWTWSGKCFGYLDGEDLWTYDGKHVGRRTNDEIYDPKGKYLGEIMSNNRLITNNAKKSWHSYSFSPYARRASYVKYTDYVGYTMLAGHTDFPPPSAF